MKCYDNTILRFPSKVLTLKDGRLVEFDLSTWITDQEEGQLEVKNILTSASGTLINGRVYPGAEWKKTYKEFIDKPFLKHHNVHQDAVGRISSASFQTLLSGTAFKNDKYNPSIQGKNDQGPSGIVWTNAKIADIDAIAKIKDRRILTVSQGSDIEHAYCSVCGTDRTKEYCEHRPYETYETKDENGKKRKVLCYFIIEGIHPYELSAVNRPAYKKAMILDPNQFKDETVFEQSAQQIVDMQHEDNLLTHVVDSIQISDKGQTRDLIFLDEEPIEVMGNSETKDSDNLQPESKEIKMTEEKKIEDMEKSLKEALDKVSKLESEKEDLLAEKKKLRDELAEKTEAIDSVKKQNESLQEKFAEAIERERQDLIADYLSVRNDLSDEAKKEKVKVISDMDVLVLRRLVDEVKEMQPKGNAVETVDDITQGNQVPSKTIKDEDKDKPKKNKRKLPV